MSNNIIVIVVIVVLLLLLFLCHHSYYYRYKSSFVWIETLRKTAMKSTKQKLSEALQESETLLDSLLDYLKGQEWQQSIEMYVIANCKEFKHYPKEFTHHHNTVWKDYQEIVETILDVALSNVGGSIDGLEKALDLLASSPATGNKNILIMIHLY